MESVFEKTCSCRRQRSAFLLSLAVAAALVIAACEGKRPEIDLNQKAVAPAPIQPKDTRPELKIAVAAMISPETTRAYYEELLSLIGDKMGRKAVFSQRRSYAEANELVKKKEVDFAFVCAGPYIQGKKDFGMELLVVPQANGKTVYHSYIITGRSSPVKSFDDLRGKKFAFTDPNSNTGALVPTYMLARRGETPKTFFRETFYTNSHDNSIKAVAEGLADGAAVDSLIYEFINRINPALTARTRIVEKSPPYGIPPIVVPSGLNAETKQNLKHILLTLHEDKKGAELMGKLQIDRFVEGNDGMYDTVREMTRWIEQKSGK